MAKLSALKKKIASVPLVSRPSMRDPRATSRVALGVLLIANTVAALFAYRPWADSPQQLEQQLVSLKKDHIARRLEIERLKIRVKKSEQARSEGDQFLAGYFLGRRTAASTLAIELTTMAKNAGIKPKEHSFAFEQVEGSETLAMMTITANYEGTYADLIQYTNKLDRSPRFFIIESLAAAPQQGGNGVLNIAMKVNVFVRDDAGEPIPTRKGAVDEEETPAAAEPAKPAGPSSPQVSPQAPPQAAPQAAPKKGSV